MGKRIKVLKTLNHKKGKRVELWSSNGERWRGMLVGVIGGVIGKPQLNRDAIEITGTATDVSISHDGIVIAGNFKRHDERKIELLLSPDEKMTLCRILGIDDE